MSLYIHPENQNLLWNIINKNNVVNNYFVRYPPGTKETWFKQIIQSFYEQNKNILVSNEQLYEINKNTIQYMVKDVRRNIEYQQSIASPPPNMNPYYREPQQPLQQQPQMLQSDFLRPYSVTENKEDKMAAQYNEYQKNYMSMFDKKVPESVNFSENIREGAINNMEELVKRHLQERDEELKKYAPPPLFAIPQQQSGDSSQIQNANRLVIDRQSEPIHFSVEELEPSSPKMSQKIPDAREPNNIQKQDSSVKWLDNENSNKIDELRKDFQEFQSKILGMFEKILDKEREPMYIGDIYSFPQKNINK